jgi:2-octaprenyl-6-methoxyphenol hydroxylase
MEARAATLQSLVRIDDDAATIDICDNGAVIHCKGGGAIEARLVVGADGRHSICRDAAGIHVERRPLDQAALTFNVKHSRPHQNVSTEFHTPRGPCVFVPLPGDQSSVVWVTTPAEAARLAGLDDDQLSTAIERQSHFHLGQMCATGERHVFPLAFEQPDRLAANRVALIGEAAHVVPPIGAQGLNLGLRDAAAIAEIVVDAHKQGGDVGSADVLARYNSERRADIVTRTLAVDLLNRSLLADFLPAHGARGLSLYFVGRIGPLRRTLMREGVMPAASQPKLMRGEMV